MDPELKKVKKSNSKLDLRTGRFDVVALDETHYIIEKDGTSRTYIFLPTRLALDRL